MPGPTCSNADVRSWRTGHAILTTQRPLYPKASCLGRADVVRLHRAGIGAANPTASEVGRLMLSHLSRSLNCTGRDFVVADGRSPAPPQRPGCGDARGLRRFEGVAPPRPRRRLGHGQQVPHRRCATWVRPTRIPGHRGAARTDAMLPIPRSAKSVGQSASFGANPGTVLAARLNAAAADRGARNQAGAEWDTEPRCVRGQGLAVSPSRPGRTTLERPRNAAHCDSNANPEGLNRGNRLRRRCDARSPGAGTAATKSCRTKTRAFL